MYFLYKSCKNLLCHILQYCFISEIFSNSPGEYTKAGTKYIKCRAAITSYSRMSENNNFAGPLYGKPTAQLVQSTPQLVQSTPQLVQSTPQLVQSTTPLVQPSTQNSQPTTQYFWLPSPFPSTGSETGGFNGG